MARTFNMRESLTDNDETSYENVFALQKDFRVYYDMWTTIDVYRTSEQSWRKDDFEKLDPNQLEEIVDTSNRVLARVVGTFRNKGMPNIQKIAEKVKEEVVDFRHGPIKLLLGGKA